jgi:hypothetical protein
MRKLLLGLAATASLLSPLAATSASAQSWRGGYDNSVRREVRECRRELRRADSRWEYERERRECQREIARARRDAWRDRRDWRHDRNDRYGYYGRNYRDGYRGW